MSTQLDKASAVAGAFFICVQTFYAALSFVHKSSEQPPAVRIATKRDVKFAAIQPWAERRMPPTAKPARMVSHRVVYLAALVAVLSGIAGLISAPQRAG